MLRRIQKAVALSRGSFVSDAIEAQVFPHMGVGIVATKPIEKNTLLFKASRDVWQVFSAEFAWEQAQQKAPGFLQQIEKVFGQSNIQSLHMQEAIILAIHLLVNFTDSASNQNLLHMEYLSSLPDFVDLPFYWGEDRLKELEGSKETLKAIEHGNLFYHCFYENLFGTNPSKAFIQREDFFWALSILMSRATSGKNQPFTLIPFFDWFNHEGDLSKVNDACFHTFNEKEGFVVISNRAYTPGEQIFIHYGNHSNQKLLRNYGFTLPNNPLDTIHLELPKQIIQTRLAEPFGEAKRQILEVIGLEKHDTIHLTSKGITLESYKWIEILMARSFDELNHVLHNTSNTKKNNNSMNPHVNDLIQSLCKQRLEKYKTLYEMDASRLKQSQGQLATWLQACVHIRMGDQQMLRNVLRK